jgi:adenylate cyclase
VKLRRYVPGAIAEQIEAGEAGEAGEAIFSAMEELAMAIHDSDAPPLSVGVGIATGEAYVGNIKAVDRMIWSAIGNTTNLAVRLQQLTRDLGTSIVIDATTWHAARLSAPAWIHFPDTRIRGRTESVDMYGIRIRR